MTGAGEWSNIKSYTHPIRGRRVLRDLRIDRVPVRQDDRGAGGTGSKAHLTRSSASPADPRALTSASTFPCSSRRSFPGVALVNLAVRKRSTRFFGQQPVRENIGMEVATDEFLRPHGPAGIGRPRLHHS